VSAEALSAIADEIEQYGQGSPRHEIASSEIGEMVMSRLKDIDEVSYVRFASVYREFKDVNSFMQELTDLMNKNRLES
jgi:transcriptional repressor NrdR